MAQKPLSVARQDYMSAVCDATNRSDLPAFVVVEVLEKALAEMRRAADNELKRDTASYHKALIDEKAASEVSDNGRDSDQ